MFCNLRLNNWKIVDFDIYILLFFDTNEEGLYRMTSDTYGAFWTYLPSLGYLSLFGISRFFVHNASGQMGDECNCHHR